jgi:acyl transferase domain-containing protein
MAAKALEQAAHAAVLHCRSLNPYVATALADWGGRAARLVAAVPRQMGPAVAAAAKPGSAAGTSSFGMSGTNAHALLSLPFVPAQAAAPAATWHRARRANYHMHAYKNSN